MGEARVGRAPRAGGAGKAPGSARRRGRRGRVAGRIARRRGVGGGSAAWRRPRTSLPSGSVGPLLRRPTRRGAWVFWATRGRGLSVRVERRGRSAAIVTPIALLQTHDRSDGGTRRGVAFDDRASRGGRCVTSPASRTSPPAPHEPPLPSSFPCPRALPDRPLKCNNSRVTAPAGKKRIQSERPA